MQPLVDVLNRPATAETVHAIVAATMAHDLTGQPPAPWTPDHAWALYDAYVADAIKQPYWIRNGSTPPVAGPPGYGGARLPMQYASSPAAVIAAAVHDYFGNPYRYRLRRCGQCARYFLDLTRNRSALRCSRACTVKWGNAHQATA